MCIRDRHRNLVARLATILTTQSTLAQHCCPPTPQHRAVPPAPRRAPGPAAEAERVALHRRRLHARKQTFLGRKISKLHAVFACASTHAMTAINQRRRARQNGQILPDVCCPSAGTSRPRQLRLARLTCEKRHRKSEGAAEEAGAMQLRAAGLATKQQRRWRRWLRRSRLQPCSRHACVSECLSHLPGCLNVFPTYRGAYSTPVGGKNMC